MELWILKIFSLSLISIISFVMGLLPLKPLTMLKNKRIKDETSKNIIDYLNCFAGGIFLGTLLLHLLPEVNEQLAIFEKANGLTIDYPLAEFLTAIGFLLVLILENLAVVCQRRWVIAKNLFPSESGEHSPLLKDCQASYENVKAEIRTEVNLAEGQQSDHNSSLLSNSHPPHSQTYAHHHCHDHHPSHSPPIAPPPPSPPPSSPPSPSTSSMQSGMRAVVLLLALSLHMIFEGLAVGLQNKKGQMWSLTIAILLHKSIIIFSLGVQFTKQFSNDTRRIVTLIAAFSIMTPVGIAVGTVITFLGNKAKPSSSLNLVSAVLQGLSTGTFLFVSFFEILHKAIGDNDDLMKILCVLFGFSLSALVNFYF
ncbi:DgyrCDS9684 [Dimorphilus gyrociliatus]|uniref:DgyrCDS9684 n=1 Tax=Dimorphilus gyrociliatus TaxID=2664684 RepID=A0A7I8VZC6_9ANNE|nr:DgyrCDS9684 [Dimorphilus gyrociliatus]